MKKLIPLLLVLGLVACEEKEDRIPSKVYGTLHIEGSEIPIPHAKITLISLVDRKFGVADYFIDSSRSDENGNYAFEFSVLQSNLNARLELICEAPNFYGTRYFFHDPFRSPGHFPAGGIHQYNPSLVPYSWIELTLDIQTPNDWFYLQAPYNPAGNISIQNASLGTHYIQVKGNSWNKIEYEIKADGQSHQFEDSIFAGILDTTLYRITF